MEGFVLAQTSGCVAPIAHAENDKFHTAVAHRLPVHVLLVLGHVDADHMPHRAVTEEAVFLIKRLGIVCIERDLRRVRAARHTKKAPVNQNGDQRRRNQSQQRDQQAAQKR